MAFKVEVKGLGVWAHNGKIYKTGEHVVDDETVKTASERALRGHSHGKEYGVFVTDTKDELSETPRSFHEYPPAPRPINGAIETEPGVFENVNDKSEVSDPIDKEVSEKPSKRSKSAET